MNDGPLAQASSSESSGSPTWNLLPPPEAARLAADDPEPSMHRVVASRTLHLVSWPTAFIALATTSGLVFTILAALSSTDGVEMAKTIAVIVILVVVSGFLWFAVIFPPRLTVDAEGLRWFPVGQGGRTETFPWADIATLRLQGQLTQLGNNLSLNVRVRAEGESADQPPHAVPRDIDERRISLGHAGFGRVDRTLRRYARCDYSSSRW